MQDIADEEHISKYYLAYFIKERPGMTFHELVNEIRFEKALNLLTRTDMTIIDIAIACGFSDSKYFNKLMKDKYGCSAKKYKLNHMDDHTTIMYELVYDNHEHLSFNLKDAIQLLEKYSTI